MKRCNLCGLFLIRIHKGPFGLRCPRCLSTFIHRATGVVLNELNLPSEISVHEFSAHGAIFKYLKKRYKNFSYSEYFDGVPSGTMVKGIMSQDVQSLSFPDSSFDLITSTEVFEHVVDDRRGFSEVLRVLKNNGHFVFTVPLDNNPETVERAYVENNQIVHIMEPEYHGDHLRKKGILAFRNYGLDIKKRLADAGFRSIKIIEVIDKELGIIPKKVIHCTK